MNYTTKLGTHKIGTAHLPYPVTGYTYPESQPATKHQLIALRDLLLSHGDKHAAAAVDNVLDILARIARLDALIEEVALWQDEVEATRKSDYPR